MAYIQKMLADIKHVPWYFYQSILYVRETLKFKKTFNSKLFMQIGDKYKNDGALKELACSITKNAPWHFYLTHIMQESNCILKVPTRFYFF